MTLSTTTNTKSYTGDGSTTDYSFPYKVFQSSHVVVNVDDVASTAWSATGYGDDGGITITFTSAPDNLADIDIQRIVPYEQDTDFQNFDGNPADVTEKRFDLVYMALQQLDEQVGRSFLTSIGTSITSNVISGTIDSTTRVLTITTSGVSTTTLGSFPTDIDITETSLANNDFMVYNTSTSTWENKTLAATKTLLGIGSNALQKEGSNVASAATTDIGAADSTFIEITGTTTITSFGTTTTLNHVWIKFADALTLTHNATSLILPGGANITTAAGDRCEAIRLASGDGNWMVVNYQRADGRALVVNQASADFDMNSNMFSFSKGADVASASALAIGTDGNYFDVTGTTTITSINTSGTVGTMIMLQFDGALVLTHHATDLILPSGANITTAAGDHAIFVEYASGDWRCVSYQTASGDPVTGSGSGSLILLSTATASASSEITFASGIDSTYEEYELHIVDLIPATDDTGPRIQTSTDGGSTYDSGAGNYEWCTASVSSDSGTPSGGASASDTHIEMTRETAGNMVGSAAGEAFNAVIKLFNPAGTNNTQLYFDCTYNDAGGNTKRIFGEGSRISAADVDAIRIYMSSGNIASGEFKLYGVVKS